MNECCNACLKMLPSSECVKKDCPCHTQKTSTPGWESEFREYFDKNLKPKKAGIRNLDREILVNFIRTVLSDQQTSLIEEIEGKKLVRNPNKTLNSLEEMAVTSHNTALDEIITLIKEKSN